ncbi:MAG TPA: MafI family immunity protein [Myxococcales bacterium]|jgi:hypothetical protein
MITAYPESENMQSLEIQRELRNLIKENAEGIPPHQIAQMIQESDAGEPRIALEDFCTQLSEYDIAVSPAMVSKLEMLARQMSVDESYWKELIQRKD